MKRTRKKNPKILNCCNSNPSTKAWIQIELGFHIETLNSPSSASITIQDPRIEESREEVRKRMRSNGIKRKIREYILPHLQIKTPLCRLVFVGSLLRWIFVCMDMLWIWIKSDLGVSEKLGLGLIIWTLRFFKLGLGFHLHRVRVHLGKGGVLPITLRVPRVHENPTRVLEY